MKIHIFFLTTRNSLASLVINDVIANMSLLFCTGYYIVSLLISRFSPRPNSDQIHLYTFSATADVDDCTYFYLFSLLFPSRRLDQFHLWIFINKKKEKRAEIVSQYCLLGGWFFCCFVDQKPTFMLIFIFLLFRFLHKQLSTGFTGCGRLFLLFLTLCMPFA